MLSSWKTCSNTWRGAYFYGGVQLHVILRQSDKISSRLSGIQVSQRWIFAVMASLAMANAYTMRLCLSLAITEMVSPSETTSNGTVSDETCPTSESTSSSSSSGGTYEWDEYTQGVILSSFYWGYIITQIPGGLLAEKYGGKYTLGLGIFFTAVCTLLTPTVVQTWDSTGLIALRVLMGFGEGTSYPALSVLIAQWAPPNERTKISTLATSGAALGTLLGNVLSGVLIQYSSIRWPIVFYFFGTLGILWFLAWLILCYSSPDEHPFISDAEKNYLYEMTTEHTHKETKPTPWRHILTSAPVWALIAGQSGYLWAFYTLSTDLPKYMSGVLKFSVSANGYLTAFPYILKLMASIASSWAADWLIKSKKMSRTNVRKCWMMVAMIIPAVFIIAASYAGCDRIVVVIFFTIGVTFMGGNYSSSMVNPMDLSPNYSGTISAIVNTVSTLAGILAPYVVGILTPNQTVAEWRVVFWITFVISWLAAIIFGFWAQGEVQMWNDPKVPEVEREVKANGDTAFPIQLPS